MKTFFTSDTHFGHANIIKYCNRPFKSMEQMDDEMIRRWNSKVSKEDRVFHLGDFAFHKPERIRDIVKNLNGTIFVVPGNHDKPLFKALDKYNDLVTSLKITIVDPLYSKTFTTDDQEVKIIMCHYAMKVWDQSHFGSFHLYGHSHGTLAENPNSRSMDVGVDTNNFYPWELDEIMVKMYRKEVVDLQNKHG